jgi:lipid-A-disaccharide synthase
MTIRIGVVIGEASGDVLGEGLIKAVKRLVPDAQFEGVAGPKMKAAGCSSLFDYERLAVMGFIEPLKRLPELLSIRTSLIDHFIDNPPDVFVGIDAPDFNLTIERKLKAAGIKTVHYVSPSVWAWRQYRIRKIARSVDLMLTLFPFEADFYNRRQVPVRFVGHTLADEIPLEPDMYSARKELGLDENSTIIGLLPGSRGGEVSLLAEPFFEAAKWCLARNEQLYFVVPLASDKTYDLAKEALLKSGLDERRVTFFKGNSRRVMEAANVLLLASGTATLEALLLKRPMVMAYKLSPFTYWLAKRLVKLPYYSLANLLIGRALIREFIQEEMIIEDMGRSLLDLTDDKVVEDLRQTYLEVHKKLKRNASERAAQAILELTGKVSYLTE